MENNNIKVSVIIPVYNTEKYVREAVDSISKQTLKELEIILVNDGSTDYSLNILNELSAKDKRIQVFSQANQGASIARNTGIANAHGKYVYFMDSDDLLEEDAMELCFRKCEDEQLDFVFFDALSFVDGNLDKVPSLHYHRTEKLEDKTYTGNDVFRLQLQNREFTPSPCLSFIRKKLLDNSNLRFYPGIVHEDQLFTVSLYLQAEKVGCIKRSFFHRRLRENSIMTREFSSRNLKGYFTVVQEILKLQKSIPTPAIRQTIDLYLTQMLNAIIQQAYTLPFQLRIRLTWVSVCKYKKYISNRSIGILLFKTYIHKNKKKKINGK